MNGARPLATATTRPQWRAGDRFNWSTTRGNYGFRIIVAGVVRNTTPRRVTIEVALRIDGRWQKVRRTVPPDKLSPRTVAVPAVDDFRV